MTLNDCANCCDFDGTPNDEGLDDGWQGSNPEATDRCVAESNWNVNAIVIRHGCADDAVPDDVLRRDAQYAASRGLTVLMGCEDRWCGRHGIDSCGVTPAMVRRGEHNACMTERIRRCVAVVEGIERVIFEAGNELPLDTAVGDLGARTVRVGVRTLTVAEAWDERAVSFRQMARAVPLVQSDLRAHEQYVIDTICDARGPDAEIATNAITGAAHCNPAKRLWRWVHGDPTFADPTVFPMQEMDSRTLVVESGNEVITDEWQIGSWTFQRSKGSGLGAWRGQHSREDWRGKLSHMGDIRPAPTPTPGPPPPAACLADSDWTPGSEDCDSQPGDDDVLGAQVQAAMGRVIASGRFTSPIPEGRWSEYTQAVADELHALNVCAAWGSPPRANGEKHNPDEVGVWAPGDAHEREQWDVLQGEGNFPFRHFAARCVR